MSQNQIQIKGENRAQLYSITRASIRLTVVLVKSLKCLYSSIDTSIVYVTRTNIQQDHTSKCILDEEVLGIQPWHTNGLTINSNFLCSETGLLILALWISQDCGDSSEPSFRAFCIQKIMPVVSYPFGRESSQGSQSLVLGPGASASHQNVLKVQIHTLHSVSTESGTV